jgi:ribosome-binding factor A
MSQHRIERVNELMQRETASALFRALNPAEFDHASVTVTHAITSPDLRSAKILVSIFGDAEKKARLMTVLLRHRADVQREVTKHVKLKWMPRIHFELDESLEKGDRVLQILDQLPPAANNQDGNATKD